MLCKQNVLIHEMTEARRLKAGRWRIYDSLPRPKAMRDPVTGAIVTFDTLEEARAWLARVQPRNGSLSEASRCAKCGGYSGPEASFVFVEGKFYHVGHAPRSRVRA